MEVYASYWDSDIRVKSSSGGFFTVVATKILEKSGVVYGVAMTTDCYGAEFIRVIHKTDLGKLRGSKYLQAKLGDTFKSVKHDLEDGKIVLFSGTGCQINGLKSYLGKEYSNLYCVDIICHGVPSSKVWKQYVLYRERNVGKIREVNFRCKQHGWHQYGSKENEIFVPKELNPYMHMFLKDLCLRPSCYECSAKSDKNSDITMGDFWGIERIKPYMDDNKGTSLIIVRTRKGKEIFESIKNELKYQEVTYEEAVRHNPSEYSSVPKPKERDVFYIDLQNMSFDELIKTYVVIKKENLKDKIKYYIRRLLKW